MTDSGMVSRDDVGAFADLIRETAGGWYYDTPAWYGNFAETCLDPGDRLRVDAVLDGGRPVLVLPLRERPDRLGPLTGRRIESLTNFYSCRHAPLLAARDPADAVACWAAEVRRSENRPGRLVFEALDRPSAGFTALESGLRRAGYLVEADEQFGNWYLPVTPGGFASWWAARNARLRHTVERKERALARNHRLSIDIFDEPAQAERAIAGYERVYAQSWKTPEPYPDFMPGVIRSGFAAGGVRVGLLSIDGEPAAAQLWVVWGGRATIFKLAYAEPFRRHSAGSILTRHMIRAAFDGGAVAEIDFGWGDDAYKQEWLPQRRQRWMLTAYDPKTLSGAALVLRYFLPRRIKRRLLGP